MKGGIKNGGSKLKRGNKLRKLLEFWILVRDRVFVGTVFGKKKKIILVLNYSI
jgi:hypothetical protein